MHDTDDHTSEAAQLERIKAEIADSFDEELELQLEEERMDALVADGMSAPGTPSLERQAYFRGKPARRLHRLVEESEGGPGRRAGRHCVLGSKLAA